MNTIGRDNNVKSGFLDYPNYTKNLLERLTEDVITAAIPDEKLKKIRRVIVTGNGDSYAAALATREFNSRMFKGCLLYTSRCV